MLYSYLHVESMTLPTFKTGVFKTRNGEIAKWRNGEMAKWRNDETAKWQHISVFRREKEMYVSNVLNLQRLSFKIRSKPARKHTTHLRYIVN